MNRWIFLRDIIYNSLSSSSGESDHMHATVACYRSASSHSRNKKNPRLLFMNIDLLGWSSRLKDSLIIEVRLDWTRLIEFWNSIFLKAGWTVLVRVSMTDLGSEKDGRWENWLTASRPACPVPGWLISHHHQDSGMEWFIIKIASNITSLPGIWRISQFIWQFMVENSCGCSRNDVLYTVCSNVVCSILTLHSAFNLTLQWHCRTVCKTSLSEYEFVPL